MENQSTYRIRTKLGETEPINIPVNLMQEYNSFEILSLKINTDDTYRSYTSTEGIVVGRVSTANNGLGIPNVRVSIFVPKGAYEQSDEEAVIYPFSSPTDMDGDRVRYNLLPSESDVDCYQVIGTLPTKRKILDNETICEVFDKFYKYTTVTNEAGDFMLTNIPVGKQRLHIDADLSDIGPFLSQKPYNMIENLGFEKNRFESTRQFKTSKDLDSLAQVISQDKSVHVYPYWGDATENGAEMKITRTDLSLNYEFKTQAIFIGSVITDKQSNSIRQNCTATEKAGKMSDMVTGPGRIEMIRKTVDNKIEQYKVKGDLLINDNGVWCYAIPMNLDYVCTDEFGNIVPTDDPNKGVPTRARVRFRITLNQMQSDNDAHKRCSYLVPNNPQVDDEKFLKNNDADYSFGSDTWDESFVDLFWNKVYTVKNYVPRIQKTVRPTNRKHTGIKMVNHFGDNNPFPYNSMSIKLNFLYRLICVIVHIFMYLVYFINVIISIIGLLPCWLAGIKIWKWRPFKFALKLIPPCIELSSEFCDDGINKNVTFPGCTGCVWTDKTKPDCDKEQYNISQKGGEAAVCTNNDSELFNCVENQLAQDNEATSFNFANDWINGCLYMPLWYRKIKPKKSFFFGLFKRKAKDQWCAGEKNEGGRQLKLASFCAHTNSNTVSAEDFKGKPIKFNTTKFSDNCGNGCHEVIHWIELSNGVIINRENMYGQKLWYYKAVEVSSSLKNGVANEYLNYEGLPMVSKLLYATDIVLLGSLNDCDLNGIPKFFNYLKGSTYNMPTDILFTDTEIEYTFDEQGNVLEQQSHKISVSSGCDWGNNNEYGYNDGGLFYSIGCSSIKVDTESCHNLRRICEIGVGQDEMQFVENIDVKNTTGIGAVNISSETDELDYNELDYYLRPDGYISYDDIIDFDYRSMFATMNGNRLKTKVNEKNGVREYDFRYLYINNFDGSLEQLMQDEQKHREKANYKFNYKLEQASKDYLLFRMSDRPFFYDGSSLVNGTDTNEGPNAFTLPKYQNSFYFYFGLKEGKTAIDLFNEQYNEPCSPKAEEEESIPYEVSSNGWCASDSDMDGKFNHENFDGYLKINLENLPLPCTAILNSRTNSAVTYTITSNGTDTNITNDKICFYGSKAWSEDDVKREFKGYEKYYLIYENPSYDNFPEDGGKKCEMLTNGEYNLYITDGEGNYHSTIINLKGEYLQFENVERKFGQPNNVLLKYYQPSPIIQYNNVALSPNSELIKIVADDAGVPVVDRIDKEMPGTRVVQSEVVGTNGIKLNGTICIYGVMFDGRMVDDLLIEVEPYDKGKDENGKDYYIDKDFWKTPGVESTKYETWYKMKMFNSHPDNKICKDASINVRNNREYVVPSSTTDYFYYKDIAINGMTVRCYVIKCPKGDVNYRVRVTQLCKDSNGFFKSQNYIERKINVGQPTPYKLLINDADYDIIKNFKSGYILQQGGEKQEGPHIGKNPFVDYNFNAITGWTEISDINKNYEWSEDEEKYGPTSKKFDVDIDNGGYILTNKLQEKLDCEPIEPQRYNYNDESKYNDDYNNWLRDHEEWENGYMGSDGNRETGYNVWTTVDKSKRLGGCCGYIYIKKEAEILLNRLEFVKAMKASFWLQCENSEKTISYSVRTDDNPYDVWTMYNPEVVSPSNDDYNETESEAYNDVGNNREKWHYIGESKRYISNIKIPTITSYSSEDFGISEDNVRKNMPNTYDGDKCFGQDNIAENSKDSGTISIKPPYLVACVNSEGMTKPNNLKKGQFFAQTENNYGLEQYKFGNVEGCGKYINNGSHEFFAFHLIDKIFAPDIVLWSYINNVPYYRPWYDYDEEPIDANALGYVIKTEGIISGLIKNGITSSRGYVKDFEEKNIFDKDTAIKTFAGASEDDIPTKRCILYGEMKKDEDNKLVFVDDKINPNEFVYRNYRHVDPSKIEELHQFRPVPNREGELSFIDEDGNCETTRTLYGSMKVTLLSNTLNDTSFKSVTIFGHKFSTSDGENGDKSLTLKVKCSNADTDDPIMYYIFETSMRCEIETAKDKNKTKPAWYPLNAFEVDTVTDPKKYKYWLTFNEGDYNLSWDGSSKLAPQIFSKVTLEKDFRDKYNVEKYVAAKEPTSSIQWENEDGEVKYDDTTGYGNTGIFANLNHKPYFVVGVTKNKCCAISPVYDFHIVYYVAGLVDVGGGQKVLRTALVYVLKHKDFYYSCNDSRMDTNDGYNAASIGPYCKQPRNYYLTQFDFKINYTFANGTTIVTNEGISYEKTKVNFLNRDYFNDSDPVGSSYVKDIGGDNFEIHTKNEGVVNQGETKEKPSGTQMQPGTYSYKVIETINGEDGKPKQVETWKIVIIDENGNMTDSGSSETDPGYPTPNGYIEIVTINPETGEEVKTYKTFEYSTETVIKVNYDPRIPYFIRYNDKSLTDDEYESLKTSFSFSKEEIEKNAKYYVTDVTGLKHKCQLHKIIKDSKEWKDVLKYPK